jgi:hypothetical protein
MDRSVAWKAVVVQLVAVGVVSGILALLLPHSFFDDWGWVSGPAAWVACSALTARVLSLPVIGALTGSIIVGIPAAICVIAGVHWLGVILAVLLFGVWCGRLAVDPGLDAELV